MYVGQIKLSNIRGFTGEREVDLALPAGGSWTVLAGRNGSGKTTMLRALALALTGPSVARTVNPDFRAWLSHPTPRDAEGNPVGSSVQATVVRDAKVDHLVGRGKAIVGPWTLGVGWSLPAISQGSRLRREHPVMVSMGTQSAERGPWADNPRGWFCAGYGPFRRLTGGSGEAQRLMLADGPAGRMVTLFHEDASLAEGVTWARELHLRRLEKKKGAAELLDTALQVLSDGLLPDGYVAHDVSSEGILVRHGRSRVRYALAEMSDGYRTVAALMLDIIRQIYNVYGSVKTVTTESGGIAVTAPGVVLIDEIETHMHVTWQQAIGGWMREHFPNIQFIVSTHSPYVCQAASAGGLIRLPGPSERHGPEVVGEDLYHRIVYGSGDDATVSELFGLETPYSGRAMNERRRLVELEEKVFAKKASAGEIAEYSRLSELLVSSLEARVTEVAASLGGNR